MPQYEYSALNSSGAAVSGSVASETRQGAIATLAGRGVFVTDMQAAGSHADAPAQKRILAIPGRGRVPLRAKAPMLRQLATALKAGLPLLQALRVVQQQADTSALRTLAEDLAAAVQGGDSLSAAMEARSNVFTKLEASMVRVGETAGVLDEVMGYLCQFAEKDLEVRQRIRSAATYPMFVLGLAVISVIIVVAFILPRILLAVTDNTAILPGPTLFLLGLSNFIASYWWALLAVAVAAGWGFRRWLARPAGRLAFDRFLLRVPVLGMALRRIAVARFARTLGTLSKSGIGILESLKVLRDTLGNESLAVELDKVAADITQGQSIAEPLQKTGQFPPLLIQVIAMGERTGRLDELLLSTAETYEKETDASIQRVMTVLPAVLIVLLALVVAFVLVSILLPIVNMETAVPGM